MLNSYLPGINTFIFPKRHYDNIFSGKLVNELHYWILNHLHGKDHPNVSDSLFTKINGTLVKKQNHLPQISVLDLHIYMILPISPKGFFYVRTVDGKLFIGDTSLIKYRPKIYKTNDWHKYNHMYIKNMYKFYVTSIKYE